MNLNRDCQYLFTLIQSYYYVIFLLYDNASNNILDSDYKTCYEYYELQWGENKKLVYLMRAISHHF